MNPSAYAHLDEISKILAGAILRIEAATSETNETNKHYNGNLLDFAPHSSISEIPYNLNQRGDHCDNAC